MAAPTRPASSLAFQREKWVFVPTIVDITAPTVAEVTAGTVLDISCYLFDDSGTPAQSTNRVTAKRRVCDGAQYERIGITTYTGSDLSYAFDPQSAALSAGKLAFEKFPAGTTGYNVRRLGIAVDTDLASGQFVDVFPVEYGPQMPIPVGDAESSEVSITQAFAITSAPAFTKAIVT